ncbi:family 16 glycoside hydrolase [Pontibacter toksunensis]|uniref:Family 16 glycoside hydrolase n=1 Tax=Pontibacter toksunensis TaxID=1332631 RepID=A0ABW6BYW4_9BACT
MKKIYALLAFVATVVMISACASQTGSSSAQADNTLTKKEKNAGWVSLFDGESMDKWRGFKKDNVPDAWQIEDGAIALTGKGGGDIVTKEEYKDFELMLDWKISEGGNSGIFFNVSEDPKFQYTFQTGPEVQIIDDERHPDAKQGKNGNRKAGTNYDLHPLSEPAVKPAGEYNTVRLVVKNGHVEQYLNGKKVVEYTLWSPEWERMVKESKFASMPEYGTYKSGHIALQDHGDKVWFKNIKIRPL